MPPVRVWIMAARPKTLGAAAAPVIMGVALAWADGRFHALSAAAACAGALLIQIGTNFANDYFDWAKGADRGGRLGPVRVTQAGLVSPGTMRRGIACAFAAATLVGVYLVARGGWPVVVVGVTSILWGILYTGGPFPLGYYGLGDPLVLVYFGPVALGGTYYVQALSLPWQCGVIGLTPGLYSVAILTVNNLRDIDADREAGKLTVAVRLGRKFTRAYYTMCVGTASLLPGVLALWGYLPSGAAVASLSLLASVPLIRTVWMRSDGPSLNRALAQTSGLCMLCAVLCALGVVCF